MGVERVSCGNKTDAVDQVPRSAKILAVAAAGPPFAPGVFPRQVRLARSARERSTQMANSALKLTFEAHIEPSLHLLTAATCIPFRDAPKGHWWASPV